MVVPIIYTMAHILKGPWYTYRHVFRAPSDDIDIRILQNMISGLTFYQALEPDCAILVFLWSFGPRIVPSHILNRAVDEQNRP